MNKRLISLVFSMIIVFVLSACGGTESPATPPAQPTEAVAEQVPPTEAVAEQVPPTQPPAVNTLERQDIPLMADAANLSTVSAEGNYVVTYQSADSLDNVLAFYQAEMPPLNWSYRAADTSVVSDVSGVLYFDKASEQATITLTNMGTVTQVVITVGEGGDTQPVVESVVEPTAAPTTAPVVEPTAAPTIAPAVEPTAAPTTAPTAAPTAAPTEAPSGSGGRTDIPLTADATNVSVVDTPDSYTVRYQSVSPLDTIIAFYESEMPLRSWSYQAGNTSIVPGLTATLYFNKAGETASVTMTNVGGYISIEVVVY